MLLYYPAVACHITFFARNSASLANQRSPDEIGNWHNAALHHQPLSLDAVHEPTTGGEQDAGGKAACAAVIAERGLGDGGGAPAQARGTIGAHLTLQFMTHLCQCAIIVGWPANNKLLKCATAGA